MICLGARHCWTDINLYEGGDSVRHCTALALVRLVQLIL